MTPERANRLTGSHRWNEKNERCVVCLMSRREFDHTGQPCSGEYRSGITFDLPPNDRDKADERSWSSNRNDLENFQDRLSDSRR
jgi:hypothetical protein